jgi:23S rRNA A2030 N6-methylase RlmJ
VANRHFAKLADVWKHLPMAEILAIERTLAYWETHAGNASYPTVEDAERQYGAVRVFNVAASFPALARSAYIKHLRALNPSGYLTCYPGSPLLGMLELGNEASYLFCDLDSSSVADLEGAASRLELRAKAQVVEGDGMSALHAALRDGQGRGAVAHVDPYEPRAHGPSGLSALDLAAEVISHGCGLVYWYGYDGPLQRMWAVRALARQAGGRPVWCGDMMVASHDPGWEAGDLGVATTPGTGFGVVCANLSPAAIDACQLLGEDLAAAYDGVALPDGAPGYIDFKSSFAADRP